MDTRTSEPAWSRTLTAGLLALLVLGVAWRVGRYLLQFPMWGDEAHIALNLLDRDYAGLMQPLRFVQTAPLLFLWAERAALQTLGDSELSLRLLSVLAGVVGLLLFWRLARQATPGLAGVLAVGILAVAYYPVRHSCEVKPYGVDLCVAVVLLLLGWRWYAEPQRRLWPLLLTGLMPFALGLSYPAAFVGGGVSLALLGPVWQSDRKGKLLYVLYNAVMLASFAGFYFLVGAGQYASEGGSANAFFDEAFPPYQPLALAQWLLAAHTGNMFAYPVGSHSGGSTLTTLFCLAGIWRLARLRQGGLLVLCLAPFGLTLLAAFLHRYPYAGSARYEQHLAPAIGLLAGCGAAALVEVLGRTDLARRRAAVLALGVLIAIGGIGLGRDILRPYKTDGDRELRQALFGIVAQAGPDDQIVVMETPTCMGASTEWYLRHLGPRIAWNGRVDGAKLRQHPGRLWTLYFHPDPDRPARLEAQLKEAAGLPLLLVNHDEHRMQMGWSWDPTTINYCECFEWRPAAEAGTEEAEWKFEDRR